MEEPFPRLNQSAAAHPPTAPLRIRVDKDTLSASASSTVHAKQEASLTGENASPCTPTAGGSSTQPHQCRTTTRETLIPTHLQVHQFGSRFLPHTTSPIRCVLPLQRDRLLLIGTDKGLSVMNMYPVEWANGEGDQVGIIQKGPSEAQALTIWTGEAYVRSVLHLHCATDPTNVECTNCLFSSMKT